MIFEYSDEFFEWKLNDQGIFDINFDAMWQF